MAATTDPGGWKEAGPRAESPKAPTAWSIPEIRVVKDGQGRLRIDQSDPATYGACAAAQFLATAKADPRFRDGMTKRPSTASIKITFTNERGRPQEIGIREIFCRMEGEDLVLSQIEKADGEKVKDLPILAPLFEDPVVEESDEDDMDRLHRLALAQMDEEPSPPDEVEPEPEPVPQEPARVRRMPSGPLRQYDEPKEPIPVATPVAAPAKPSPAPEPAHRGPAAAQSAKAAAAPPVGLTVRSLTDGELSALRAIIEAKAGQTRWASGLLMQAAERHPRDGKLQNEHLANLLRISLENSRAESRTPLATALRGVLEEVLSFKASVLERDPLKAEKLALQAFARVALNTPQPTDDGQVKTVTGAIQRTPAQILAKLEDPKLARATRVKFLLEIVPEMIESWRPDKESTRNEAGNENSPMIVRKLFSVANEQRQQRKYIDDGTTFRKAGPLYAELEGKLPKATPKEN